MNMEMSSLLDSFTWQNALLVAGGAYVLLNMKGVPFVWHIRLLNCLKEHIILHRARKLSITTHGAQSLFYPVITTSSSPLLEIDYNLHKSNATYFTDLDINRVHLIATLFKNQLALGFMGGDLGIALGSTACVFKREIKPYQRYEIHTRVLCWDEKWLYFVSHFVKVGGKGSVVFEAGGKGRKGMGMGRAGDVDEKRVLASAITRYVFKKGRISVAPEKVLMQAGLLPEVDGKGDGDGFWTYEMVEEERKRGLEVAKSFLALDALHGTFRGNRNAIGVF
ncbi:hypothetical protein BO70DRAFT_427379 [Aspergillus heteromorphus CBS 117.55]|uniref:Capsule polysaccharide biosynthesis protein n=1 Tax=Aspergillus heteromorphus CBS 117.55 TaxID=1448321 RepID=A0A317WLT9_9EURO|nr:uncharacterized protein BO70DRAFT_427379 [Aspergillus heteromorphus CBS 117.55]PWY87434.1 hypothetical protein BO70DRAFT_427379 [Aspergillus heteromorphus CBS 117.55]